MMNHEVVRSVVNQAAPAIEREIFRFQDAGEIMLQQRQQGRGVGNVPVEETCFLSAEHPFELETHFAIPP